MTAINQLQLVKDLPNKTIFITRNFDATPELVWRAWTESELLDQWWAPKPWRAETKSMNFTVGGHWLYAMVGPDNTRHWARVDFMAIEPFQRFTAIDLFCDAEGNPNQDLPGMHWQNEFKATDTGTQVVVTLSFNTEADLEKILEMGFEEGFAAALNNLDQYLSR